MSYQQMTIFDIPCMAFLNTPDTGFSENCGNCAYLNRRKKRRTGLKNNLIVYGCRLEEGTEIPRAVPEDEESVLASVACGMWEPL